MKSVKTSQRCKITAGKMRDTALLFSAFAILTGPAASQGESSGEESEEERSNSSQLERDKRASASAAVAALLLSQQAVTYFMYSDV